MARGVRPLARRNLGQLDACADSHIRRSLGRTLLTLPSRTVWRRRLIRQMNFGAA